MRPISNFFGIFYFLLPSYFFVPLLLASSCIKDGRAAFKEEIVIFVAPALIYRSELSKRRTRVFDLFCDELNGSFALVFVRSMVLGAQL